jgi:hippurate hydrolase
VIPERALLAGTVRALSPEVREVLARRLREVAVSVAAAFGARIELDYELGYPCTINDERCSAFAASVAEDVVGAENVRINEPPSMGSEDFSFLLEKKPGAYLWLGQADAGHVAGLHSPHYDFNDDVLPLGVALHVALVERRLRQS